MSGHNDLKLVKWLLLLLLLPLTLAIFSGDRFRYPCQDPANWDKDFCKMPICDVTRTCPEHIFKGQRDPRIGPQKDVQTQTTIPAAPTMACQSQTTQGANCGK
jgi:hypothetical protein